MSQEESYSKGRSMIGETVSYDQEVPCAAVQPRSALWINLTLRLYRDFRILISETEGGYDTKCEGGGYKRANWVERWFLGSLGVKMRGIDRPMIILQIALPP